MNVLLSQVVFNLHSTMYLLNRVRLRKDVGYDQFTFHYVSIKSEYVIMKIADITTFTFHYVSIKSYKGQDCVILDDLIYIPLCIY